MKWFLDLFKTKPLLAILLLVIIIIIIYFTYKIISGIISKIKQKGNYNAAVNQSQTALNQLAQQGVNPSYAQAQYTSWANEIEKGFDGCGSGWQGVLKPILNNLKNDADVFALIQNYGTRTFDECGWGTSDSLDLAAAIAYKFSGLTFCDCIPLWNCDAKTCGSKNEINKILQSKGIVFQF